MTSTFFVLGTKCGGRAALGCSGDHWGRIGGLLAPKSFCSANNAASAMPLSPVPPNRRKSRRRSSQRPALLSVDSFSKDINKLARVEQSATKHWQTVLPNQFRGCDGFSAAGLALKGERESALNLRRNVCFFVQARRKIIRLLHDETAIQQVERLQRRGAAGPPRRDLSGVRTIKHTENAVGPLPYDRAVDHAPECFRTKLFLRRVNAHVIVVWFEETEARTAHFQIELAADCEDRITNHFRFKAPRREAPEQSRVRIHGLTFRPSGTCLAVGRTHHDEPVD